MPLYHRLLSGNKDKTVEVRSPINLFLTSSLGSVFLVVCVDVETGRVYVPVCRYLVEAVEHWLICLNADAVVEFDVCVCLLLTESVLCVLRVYAVLREAGTCRDYSSLVVEVERMVLVEELTDSLVYLEGSQHILSADFQVELELERYAVQI